MAELAAGAVTSLLGILGNEARLLGRMGKDVQFIKAEMESMSSFLEHLARTRPPSGHNEQVRTWMKQVQDLANECSICIYLQRSDPAVHRARSGLRRYTWWSYWLVQKFLAQHSTAIRLRELKERARDISDRRSRYCVQLPGNPAEAAGVLVGREYEEAAAYDNGDDDDSDGDDIKNQATVAAADPRRRTPEASSLEDYCARKLADWFELQARTEMEGPISTISIVVPDAESGSAVASEAMGLAKAHCFEKSVRINLPVVQSSWDLPLLTREILSYILHDCKEDAQTYYDHRVVVFNDMWTKMNAIDVEDKIEMIRSKVKEVEKMVLEAEMTSKTEEEKSKNTVSYEEPLGVLLQALCLIKPGPRTREEEELLSSLAENIIKKTAKMLRWHMEDVAAAPGEVSEKPPICLNDAQYEDILRELYPEHASSRKPEEAHISTTSGTLALPHKEVTHNHKITLEIIRELPPKPQELPSKPQLPPGSADDVEKQDKEQSKEGDDISLESKKTRLITLDIVGGRELLEGNYDPAAKKQASTGEGVISNRAIAAAIEEVKESLRSITQQIKRQLIIKGIVNEIKQQIKSKKTLIVLQDEKDYVSEYWKETKKALGLLGDPATAGCSVAVIIITTNPQKAKDLLSTGEPITYSLVGLYHDFVLQLTSVDWGNEDGSNSSKIVRGILDKCFPHEFCMKMFAHALYANPNRIRSKEELQQLHDALQDSKKSSVTNAKKIFMFSYIDLTREHKTCLLYLAIFPQGHKIRRSVLIGRWLTEGLIAKKDWPTSVRHAERCFDSLIDRCLLWPGDISAAGKVKSCMLGDLIYGFIRKAAKKQHILDTCLSHLLAHHFSIFSGLRLPASDNIDNFVKNLPTYSPQLPTYSPQLPLLKLLDLEGCQCLDKNHRYLKGICSNILLVKYLSLRGTGITHLPSEINNLHELEVLDIRETKVPEHATKDIVLLKLRRLLSGHVGPSTSSNNDKQRIARDYKRMPYVQIPHKIEKMEHMEVLSKVKASKNGDELKDIRKLWQLRKIGLVIDDKEAHLRNFLRAISDLNDCLKSLSITLPETRSQDANPHMWSLREDIYSRLTQPSKLLESLSINGVTGRLRLLPLLATGNELAKVTLSRTFLIQEDLKVLAVLPKLRCVRLRHNAYIDNELTFKQNEFIHLKYFLFEGTNISDIEESMTKTDIKFEGPAAAELEKIVLSFTNVRSLCGIGSLTKLKELELKYNKFLLSFFHDGVTHNENTDSGVSKQNNQSGAPEQKTQEKTPMQNTQNEAPQQNSQSGAVNQNTRDGALEQSAESGAMEQNTQNRATEKNTQNKAPEEKTQSRFIFKEKEFEHLKYFHVEDDKITSIIFEKGAAPKLEKIFLSLTNGNSNLTGVTNLRKLKEIELIGGKFLLSSFDKADQITKVTLRDTYLKKDDLKSFPMKRHLRCLVFLENSYDESQISFDKHEFPELELLIVECPKVNSISFTDKSALNLERIVWSFAEMQSLSGIDYLPKLQELEFNGETVHHQVIKDVIAHKGKPVLRHKKPQQDQAKRSARDEDDDDEQRFPLFSCFSKIKNQHCLSNK